MKVRLVWTSTAGLVRRLLVLESLHCHSLGFLQYLAPMFHSIADAVEHLIVVSATAVATIHGVVETGFAILLVPGRCTIVVGTLGQDRSVWER